MRLLLLLFVFLSGCSSHRPIEEPLRGNLPAKFQSTSAPKLSRAEAGKIPWWKSFEDPYLDRLMARCLAKNLDLEIALERYRQAFAERQGALSPKRIQSDLQVSSGRTQFFLPGRGALANERTSIAVPFNYELDAYGRLNRAIEAADWNRYASLHDLQALTQSLTAELGRLYFLAREARAQEALVDEQLETGEKLLAILEERFEAGQITPLDVLQQEQTLEGLRARRTGLEADRAAYELEMQALLGETPGSRTFPEEAELPKLPALPDPGIPSDLLHQRPDLRARLDRIRAADERLAVALLDRFPVVRLAASLSYQVAKPSNLFENLLQGFSAELVQPLLDGGRRKAQIALQRSRLEGLLLEYRLGFLEALRDVEIQLTREAHQRRALTQLKTQEATAREAYDLASERYLEGAEDFLRVLTSLQALHQVQQNRLAAEAGLLTRRVQLTRALGGSWSQSAAAQLLDRPRFSARTQPKPHSKEAP